MKKYVLVGLLLCSLNLFAETIIPPHTYSGVIESYFKYSGVTYPLIGTNTDGEVIAFSNNRPYQGGGGIGHPAVLSSNSIALITLFNTGPSSCYGGGYIEGTLQIPDYKGPLKLRIDYWTDGVNENRYPDTVFRDALFTDENYNLLWEVSHAAHDVESYYLPVTAGSILRYFLWENVGSSYSPIVPKYYAVGTEVAIDFALIIPEPATVILLGLGGLMLRKQRT